MVDPMFKGLLHSSSVAVGRSRAAQRLITVVSSAAPRRHGGGSKSETYRQGLKQLQRLHQRPSNGQRRREHRPGETSAWRQELRAAQMEALAQETTYRKSADSHRIPSAMEEQESDSQHGRPAYDTPSSSPRMNYDDVDKQSGKSLVQTRFDSLVHAALLQYGPPLPPSVYTSHRVMSSNASVAPSSSSSDADIGADDPTAVFYDEARIRLHELTQLLRRCQPNFSIRDDCGGVPLSALVKGCVYLRVHGGYIHFLRFVRRLPSSPQQDASGRNSRCDAATDESGRSAVLLSLGKYKMREPPSQDGLQSGPQPWRYSYKLQ